MSNSLTLILKHVHKHDEVNGDRGLHVSSTNSVKQYSGCIELLVMPLHNLTQN